MGDALLTCKACKSRVESGLQGLVEFAAGLSLLKYSRVWSSQMALTKVVSQHVLGVRKENSQRMDTN